MANLSCLWAKGIPTDILLLSFKSKQSVNTDTSKSYSS